MEPPEPMEEDTPPPPESPEIPLGSCVHINHYKTENVVLCFELLHAYYVACLFKDSKEKKAKNCKCSTCEVNQFVFACLSCENFSCYEHIGDHALIKIHPLAMDIDCGRLFCCGCRDFRYDRQLENISQAQKRIAARQRGSVTGLTYGGILQREPNLIELELLKYHKIVYRSSQTDARGFHNIGNVSCYLIVIIQSLLHAPIFRDYLLSLKHECKYEKRNNEDSYPLCFICEMANIFQECFSGESERYIFSNLFYLYWRRCKDSDKIEMEDADMGYVELLEQFHKDLEGASESSSASSSSVSRSSCGCIVHNVFEFIFEKRLTCKNCLNVSDPIYEPSWIIHLLLQKSDKGGKLTVHDCLKSGFEGEILDYQCSVCLKEGCLSNTKPVHLPIVISFCINDPEEFGTNGLYEEFLDMSSYMQKSGKENKEDMKRSNPKYHYYLFSVIKYIRANVIRSTRKKKGHSSSGHYICYIRQHGQRWIKCDNEEITPVELKEVLAVKARMLFYHRMYL